MRLLLAGGGTGGHLFPAVALAQGLLGREPGAAVQFVGTEKGLEARLLPKLGLPLATVAMAGVVGRGWRGRLELLPKLLKSLGQAHRILRRFAPDLVIGVGGYASVPVLLMARLLGIPYLIHEQNAIPGLSNRLLARGAQLICLSFPNRWSGFPQGKTLVTGNPLRAGLEQVDPALPEPGKLLIFGGSRGARAINQLIIELLPLLKAWPEPPVLLHQTGDEDLERVRRAYAAAGFDPGQVVAFIDDMALAYGEARLVICRAGATTLAELTVCGRPAILIPFPLAAGDHQTANARLLAEAGAARLLAQPELTATGLAEQLQDLLNSPELLKKMAEAARALGQPGATDRILEACRRIVKSEK
jgi:UDP-N-acetylglucosamine--N-acetylmuramyl-(pentapeptide) pyrophosphoryl-undecaprenol N-acetylglucosamine transferase